MVTKQQINKVFRELRKFGYFAKQNWWCCQSCGWADISDEEQKVVFYHDQDADAIENMVLVRPLYLAWRGNGEEICDIIRSCGLSISWDGSEDKRIAILS
jgi:hypothetical protein